MQATSPVPGKNSGATAVRCTSNAKKEWEDAYAVEEGLGVAAISDGASEGIFARNWATLLVNRFVQEQPDLSDPARLTSWIQNCRRVWMKELDFPNLRWSQQAK